MNILKQMEPILKGVFIIRKGNTRSDKKFGVKLWVKTQDKAVFRSHCFNYHLSMMFVGEKYLITCLNELPDHKLKTIIEERLNRFTNINSKRDKYETLGVRVVNSYWQKLAYFAVMYNTSIAKIASCIFDYALSSYEVRSVEEKYGLTFAYNRKKRFEGRTYDNERLSDY